MKKGIKSFLFGLIALLLSLCIVSCADEVQEDAKTDTAEDSSFVKPEITITQDDLKTSSGKALLLKISTMYDAIDTLAENGLDLPEESAKGLNGGDVDFLDLINYVPASKALSDDLNTEFDTLIDDYKIQVQEILPDCSLLEDMGIIDKESNLLLIDEEGHSLALDSFEGIMAVEMINMIAEGKRPEEAGRIIQDDIETVVSNAGGEENLSKGLYSDRVCRWKDGVVNYVFASNFETKAYNAIKEAMADWTKKTGGLIKFKEHDINKWSALAYVSGFQIVPITKWNLKGGIVGDSTIGAAGGYDLVDTKINYKMIKPISDLVHSILGEYGGVSTMIRFDTDKWLSEDDYKRVPRHELGHTLGLIHEHQRPDRDKYIIVNKTGDNLNYGIYRDVVTEINFPLQIEWRYYTIKVFWKRIKIWYPVVVIKPIVKEIDYTRTIGEFDFKSIMLYDGFEVKNPANYKNDIEYNKFTKVGKTKYNTEISPKDVETIKKMYR